MRQEVKGLVLIKWLVLANAGGLTYYLMEAVYKGMFPGGITHWSMGLLGGIMFLLIGGLNNWLPWEMSLFLQATLGMLLITAAELLAGLALNVWLGLGIWDYSALPLNLWGQICLPFTLLWWPLSLVAIVLDDWLRFFLWDETWPRYHWI